MDRPGTQMLTWTLCVLLSWLCVTQAAPGPHYMVAIPSVLEAGAGTQFCASLLKPNETVVMTVTLRSKGGNMTIIKETSSQDFHSCFIFMVPPGDNEVAHFDVEVRGATFYSKEVRKVMIKTYEPMTFVQTDKPIYLPGQTVNFRVVTIDTKFRPSIGLYDAIQIADPNRNKIGQWLNQTSGGKILQLSYTLSSDAREGSYHVFVSRGKDEIYQYFKVEKYVLPKFEVKIDSSDEVSIGQNEIRFKVCAKYTYGQSVPGTITAKKCRPLHLYLARSHQSDITAPCFVEMQKADKSGCSTFAFEMATFKKLDESMMQDSLHLTAKVEEEGTGITHEQEMTIKISYVTAKLAFVDTPKIYEQGSEVVGKVKAVHYDDTPIHNKSVYLFEGNRWSPRQIQHLTTDSEGFATFRYNTAGSDGDIHLHVNDAPEVRAVYSINKSGYFQSGHHTVMMARDASPDRKTVSSLEVQSKEQALPCDTEEHISVKYTIVGEKQGSADVMYLVLARGALVMQGSDYIEVGNQSVTEGEITFKMTVSPEMAPEIQFVVYAVLPSEVVIANTADFSVEKCFSHKVSLKFSPSSAIPGEVATLQVTAQPDSLCGVSAVDQSVHIKESGKGLDADRIFNLLPVTKLSYIPYEVQDHVECLAVRPKRYILPEGIEDTYAVFKNVGLKMATNLDIRVPTCLKYGGRKYIHESLDHPVAMHHEFGGSGIAPVETVRSYFPETWIWDLVETGDSGITAVSLKAPDTITTWETEAFCLSSQGLGLAPQEKLTVFQPFFLDLSLPYSMIRGENFELKATVFNYENSCYMVTVTPEASFDYTLTPKPEVEYTTCLCSNDRKTFSWTLTPSSLGDVKVSVSAEAVESHITCNNEIVSVPERGHVDKVSKTLKVKAEGIEKKRASTWLLCPKDEVLTEKIEILLPENVIEGSARAVVSVLGDIMGRAMENLDGLLQMPYGCGEQNIALLAPNIYILKYLQDTDQLTPDIKQKGTSHLTSGYQRQLNYKHYGGAFSTFGSGSGNTWLTAFVMRSLVKAQNFIFIDQEVINESKTWLESRQQPNGCFEQLGKLFNNAMKGGVSDKVTITAYVTAAFLEMNRTRTDSVAKSLLCLINTVDDFSNTYATALQAYVFTLAGEMEIRTRLLKHLDSVAIKDGGFIHWSQSATDHSSSLSVEMTSYVLLAILNGSPSVEELGYANSMVRWLTSKQNYYGGFSSTQDTVVALQALALYSTMVYSSDGSSKVFVKSPSGQLEFDISLDNKLLYQEQVLKDVSGEYIVEVTGMVCASVQISHHYNIPAPITITNLDVKVTAKAECNSSLIRPIMSLTLDTIYTGSQDVSNMVILDIKMLSGFAPDPESLKELKEQTDVERVEHEKDHVLVYIKELAKDNPNQYTLNLIQELQVSDLKMAVVKLYDYYQPSDVDQEDYICPCAAA
ncbi:alpha-2-macroglobulin-like [Cheilinus undulatus]|uniref:alpha-2-macroglobulin-like n=1 Tax=Cheilinus undulatus TaxID=241271 RepID=UPI001BD2E3BE|nr:alpha-2-macroglobulin-like [Cheilinus undulatus]